MALEGVSVTLTRGEEEHAASRKMSPNKMEGASENRLIDRLEREDGRAVNISEILRTNCESLTHFFEPSNGMPRGTNEI
jgi:hypothetical protein